MKPTKLSWLDPINATLFMMLMLMTLHSLHFPELIEQCLRILAIFLIYGWLYRWLRKA